MPSLDVILPCYRPHPGWEERLAADGEKIIAALAAEGCEVRFHLANDGSPAGSFPEDKLDWVRRRLGRVEFWTYERNRGKGYCLRNAVARTEGDYQVYTDFDLPFGWESVVAAYHGLLRGHDVVMGVRGQEYARALVGFRKVLSRAAKMLNRCILGLPAEKMDTQAGLKGFNRRGRGAFLQTRVETFFFDTEFILIASKNGLDIGTEAVTLRPGVRFSRMGLKVMAREFCCFLGVLWRVRLFGKKDVNP